MRLPAGRSSGAAERGEAHTSNAQAQVRETKNISVLLKVRHVRRCCVFQIFFLVNNRKLSEMQNVENIMQWEIIADV